MSMQELFKALSDETRREILGMLQDGDMTAGAISDCFDTSKPTISHHLSVLKAAGLVRAERSGQEIVYSLERTVFEEFVGHLIEKFGKDRG